jgi:hypothetical protein
MVCFFSGMLPGEVWRMGLWQCRIHLQMLSSSLIPQESICQKHYTASRGHTDNATDQSHLQQYHW